MMKKINIKNSSIIQPAQETPTHILPVSNLDLLVARIHFPTVYFYKPNGCSSSSHKFFEAQVMKEALSKALVSFYPAAGRLCLDENGGIHIDCNAEGVLFVEADTASAIDDFNGDFTPRLEFQQLVPTVDYASRISSYPLVVAQVTYLQCGGISLGVGIHHTLADGVSALHFISTWADIARGSHMVSSTIIPPFHDRTLVRTGNQPSPMFHHVEYDPPPSLDIPIPPSESDNPAPISTAIFNITPEQLNSLKTEIPKFSTYEILAAHIWRCTCKARDLSNDQASKLYIATDGRFRLNPPLPLGYFGNALFTATPIALSGDLRSEPLIGTVERIRRALKRMNDEYLRSALDFLQLQPDLTRLVRGSNAFRSPNLNINSWMRLPVYEADFGWGRPVWMGPANVVYEGTAYLIPSPLSDGSLLVTVKLEAHAMKIFEKLLYDFR